jgi:transposase
LANTIEAWRKEILNYAASGGASNGFAESLNHLLKNQKRQAHGHEDLQDAPARERVSLRRPLAMPRALRRAF